MALGLEVFREKKKLKDMDQNLEGGTMTVEKMETDIEQINE